MAIAWYLAPYKLGAGGWLPWRYCAVDDFTADILADGGDWRESEIDGGQAVVRVRARVATLNRIGRGSDVGIARIDDPFLHWKPTRTAPINRGGEIAFDSGEIFDSLSMASVLKHVKDEKQNAAHLKRIETIARRADKEGYVRIPAGDWEETAQTLAALAAMGYGLDRVSTGTFPTTGVLDDFNRADGGAGANWTNLLSTLSITSNTAYTTSQPMISYYNVATYGADSESYITISTKPGTGGYLAVGVRFKDLGSLATFDGYVTQFTAQSGASDDTTIFQRIDNGAATTLGATVTQEFAAGESIGLEAIGTTLSLYRNSGGWSSLASRTDGTYAAAGNLLITLGSTTARVDDFGGGTLVSSSSYNETGPGVAGAVGAGTGISTGPTYGAFQVNAFQNNAFQIYDAGGGGASYNETGSGVAGAVASGSDTRSYSAGGAGIAGGVASGAAVRAMYDGGAGVAGGVAAGRDARAYSTGGAGITGAVASGSERASYGAGGAGIAGAVASGTERAAYTVTGAGIAGAVAAGAERATYSDGGFGLANAIASGAEDFTGAGGTDYNETGAAVAGAVAAGAYTFTMQDSGYSAAGTVAYGFSAWTISDGGAGVAGAVVSGAPALTMRDGGTGIAGAQAAGLDALVMAESGYALAGAVASGYDSVATAGDAARSDYTRQIGAEVAQAEAASRTSGQATAQAGQVTRARGRKVA